MDVAAAREESPRSPGAADLLLTPDIEIEIDNWRVTGFPPFPELENYPRNDWYRFTRVELRLIHHITGLLIDLRRHGFSNSTVWAQRLPSFLVIALSSDFVMSSIFAFSASHLAWITRNKETENLVTHHRGVAMKGLQKAISTFSKENCDAILAAYTLLSWQANEWGSWAYSQQGISSVLNAMHPYWKETSELAQSLESQRIYRTGGVTMSPSYSPSMNRFQEEDLARLDRACTSLENIQERLKHNQEHYNRISDLLSFVRRLRADFPLQAPEKAFERLQPLRTWLFWLPTEMLRGREDDLSALAVLAQFFGMALVLEPLFPEIEGLYLGGMAVSPIEDIERILLSRKATLPFVPEVQSAVALMDFPRNVVAEYKGRLQWSPLHQMNHFPPTIYHGLPDLQLVSPASSTTSTYTTYASPIHSPPAVAVPSSPFHPAAIYGPAPTPSNHFYTSSPTLHSDQGDDGASLSDYSRPGTLDHSPAFSPVYVDDMSGAVSTADGAGGLSMGLYHESPIMHIGSVGPELCWT
jgi:hypothetical protein